MWNSKLQWGERYLNITTAHDRPETGIYLSSSACWGRLWPPVILNGKGKMDEWSVEQTFYHQQITAAWVRVQPSDLHQTTGLHGDRKLYISLKMWWVSENREMKSILKVVFHSSLSIYLWEQYWLGKEESSMSTDIDPNWWFTSCPEGKQIY